MKHEEIIFSGFGGQGALFAGQLLAYAGMAEGRQVSWIPSYGPEMRGGTANCTVIVSDDEIGAPHNRSEIACPRMRDRDRAVLMQQQLRHGLPDDGRAPDDDSVDAREIGLH